MPDEYARLIEAIVAFTNMEGRWIEKRRQLLVRCSDNDRTMLGEFLAWFDGDIDIESE